MEEIERNKDISEFDGIKIRLAEERDLLAVDTIYNYWIKSECSTADTIPYSREEREVWFSEHPSDRYPVYIAESGVKVAGYFSFSPYRKRREALKYVAEISYFVSPDWKGRGLGSLLMEYALGVAQGLGYRTLIAILMEHNVASIALLRKYGFVEWGRMPGIVVFGERRYDHLYYGLNLESSLFINS